MLVGKFDGLLELDGLISIENDILEIFSQIQRWVCLKITVAENKVVNVSPLLYQPTIKLTTTLLDVGSERSAFKAKLVATLDWRKGNGSYFSLCKDALAELL